MSNQGELLLYNGMYAGASLGLILLATLLATGLFLRVANLLLQAKSLALSAETKVAFHRRVWRLALAFLLIMGLIISGGLLIATWRKVYFGDFVHSTLARLQTKDWIG